MKSQGEGSHRKQELNALVQYSELMLTAFDKMQKSLPKKFKEVKDEIAVAIGRRLDVRGG